MDITYYISNLLVYVRTKNLRGKISLDFRIVFPGASIKRIMGLVKRGNHINTLESPSSISITALRSENRRKRLEKVLDRPGLKVEDIVVAVGEKEIEEQIKKLEGSKAALEEDRLERLTVIEMKEEIKRNREEFEKVVKEIHALRDEQATSISVECDNLGVMLKDITGHCEKLEQEVKHFTEELVRAKEEETKLKEELYIAKNEKQIKMEKSMLDGKGSNSMGDIKKKGFYDDRN